MYTPFWTIANCFLKCGIEAVTTIQKQFYQLQVSICKVCCRCNHYVQTLLFHETRACFLLLVYNHRFIREVVLQHCVTSLLLRAGGDRAPVGCVVLLFLDWVLTRPIRMTSSTATVCDHRFRPSCISPFKVRSSKIRENLRMRHHSRI